MQLSAKELIVSYQVQPQGSQDPEAIAKLMARHFYPGTGEQLTTIRENSMKQYSGRVLSIFEQRNNKNKHSNHLNSFEITIAIPKSSIESNLSMLFTAIAGEVLAFGDIRLMDVQLPIDFLDSFRGPKYGIGGLRELLRIPSRPLLLAILKPCLGFSPEEGANSVYQATFDLVKDDELLSDPSYCRRSARIKLYTKAIEAAYEQTGERKLYTVNITDRSDRLLLNAIEAVELGANALMINYLQVGPDAVRSVCEDPRITVPVLGHNAGASALYGSTNTGISLNVVNGLLPRLCGLDLCIFLTPHGKFAQTERERDSLVHILREPLSNIGTTMPIVAGGVKPSLVKDLIMEYGKDIALAAGGGIFGHPEGAAAGARAFRQEIESIQG